MLIECKNCGAPLDVEEDSILARCGYCGRTQRVAGTRVQAPVTPPGWMQPPHWTPPPHCRARSVPLCFDAQKTVGRVLGFVMVVVVLAMVLPIVLVALAFAGVLALGGAR